MRLDTRDELTEEHDEPLGDLLKVPLSREDPNWTVRMGSDLDQVTKKQLATFLQENVDVFAWSAANMPRIDLEVMVH